ncbi:MAG: hypothetical protein PHE17_18145 [Thiothrix sp.]|uniref:hypothetical protein n=1 Tax=Thiothrix sp. TaxID=1032 RepID=UPI00260B4A41|nr:hypothetical protein [Thiothrix sp.]MDD5394943.1 hypothetical protein [Thiothrix sp.]
MDDIDKLIAQHQGTAVAEPESPAGDDVDALIAQHQGSAPAPKPGLIGRVDQYVRDAESRIGEGAKRQMVENVAAPTVLGTDILHLQPGSTGELYAGIPERAARFAAGTLGTAADIAGEAVAPIFRGATSAARGVYHGIESVVNPIRSAIGEEPLVSPVQELRPIIEPIKKAQTVYEQYKATQTPAGQANLSGAESAGKAAMMAAPIPIIGKPIEKAVGGAGKAIAGKIEDVINPPPEAIAAKAASAFSKAAEEGTSKGIKPTVIGKPTLKKMEGFYQNVSNAAQTIAEHKDAIKITDENGEAIHHPRSSAELAQAIDQAKKNIYSQYHSMATAAGESGANFNAKPIVDKLENITGVRSEDGKSWVIKPDLKHSPQIRDYAKSLINDIRELHGQSPEVIEARITELNQSLKAFYANPDRVTAAKAQVDASVAQALREELDQGITRATGPGYQQLKNKYGALKAIEKEVNKRALVNARRAKKNIADLTDIFTGGEMIGGLLTGHPGMILKGATGFGIKSWYKWLNNPDRYIERMMDRAYKLEDAKRGLKPPEPPPPAPGGAPVPPPKPGPLGDGGYVQLPGGKPPTPPGGGAATIPAEDIAANVALRDKIRDRLVAEATEKKRQSELTYADKISEEINSLEKQFGNEYYYTEGLPIEEGRYVKRGSPEETWYKDRLAAIRDEETASRPVEQVQSGNIPESSTQPPGRPPEPAEPTAPIAPKVPEQPVAGGAAAEVPTPGPGGADYGKNAPKRPERNLNQPYGDDPVVNKQIFLRDVKSGIRKSILDQPGGQEQWDYVMGKKIRNSRGELIHLSDKTKAVLKDEFDYHNTEEGRDFLTSIGMSENPFADFEDVGRQAQEAPHPFETVKPPEEQIEPDTRPEQPPREPGADEEEPPLDENGKPMFQRKPSPGQADLFSGAPAESAEPSAPSPRLEQTDLFGGSKPVEQLEAEEKARLDRAEVKRRQEEQKGGEEDLGGLPLFKNADIHGNQMELEFSRKGPQPEDKNLVALHNITDSKLAHADELGGLAMPSVAVTKKDIPFESFGDISLIAGKGSDLGFSRKAADPFYSPTLKAVQGLKQERGTGEQMFNMITKTPGVKEAEWKWMGLDDFLKDKPSVTKQEIADFVAQNQVRVEEVKKGGHEDIDKYWETPSEDTPTGMRFNFKDEDGNVFTIDNAQGEWTLFNERGDVMNTNSTIKEAAEEYGFTKEDYVGTDEIAGGTKYSQWKLPGGENYREVLLTLPTDKGNLYNKMAQYEYSSPYAELTKEQQQDVRNMVAARTRESPADVPGLYKSSHWSEPNVLAHVRLDDRTGPNGEKVLFVEEVQPISSEGDNAERFLKEKTPFGGSGKAVELALKRVLRMAAEEGYDRVAWINGEQTAARYDLSKQISRVVYQPGNKRLLAYDLDGKQVIDEGDVMPEKIEGYIGKEPARKLLEKPSGENRAWTIEKTTFQGEDAYAVKKPNGSYYETGGSRFIGTKNQAERIVQRNLGVIEQELKGENLRVGGEWAHNLYNVKVPQFLSKYGKKWNAKIEEVSIDNPGEKGYHGSDEISHQMSIPITPEMRESVLTEGQPLFQKGTPNEPGNTERDPGNVGRREQKMDGGGQARSGLDAEAGVRPERGNPDQPEKRLRSASVADQAATKALAKRAGVRIGVDYAPGDMEAVEPTSPDASGMAHAVRSITKQRVTFLKFSDEMKKGQGEFYGVQDMNRIFVNVDLPHPYIVTGLHESIEALRRGNMDLMKPFERHVIDNLTPEGEAAAWSRARDERAKGTGDATQADFENAVKEHLVDHCAYQMSHPEWWQSLYEKAPETVKKIIQYMISYTTKFLDEMKLRKFDNSHHYKDAQDINNRWREVYRQIQKRQFGDEQARQLAGDMAEFSRGSSAKVDLINAGAEIKGDMVVLYRGGNIDKRILKKLRYGDFLSTTQRGQDVTGNEGAAGYGKNVIRIELPISDVQVVNGEIQYKGKSESIGSGKKYPQDVYMAYNDYYGSNYTSKEIDAMEPGHIRNVAHMALSGGYDEFDQLTNNKYKPSSPRKRYIPKGKK